jgi:uncharacterized protein YdaU (DUF1376 family)
MPDKLLAEWFWTDRWMGSRGFLLPLEPRGLYREMLTQAWRREARLPNDHEVIRRACGITEKEWRRCWPLIEPFWRVDGGWLVNDTQLEIYAEAKAIADSNATRGRKGAAARWGIAGALPEHNNGHSPSNAQALPEQVFEVCPPSPSPSPSLKEREIERASSTADDPMTQVLTDYKRDNPRRTARRAPRFR